MNNDTLLWALAITLMCVAVIGTFLPLLPGAPLFFLGALLAAWINDFQIVGWLSLSAIAVLCVVSTSTDYVASALGAKRYGASRLAILLSLLGTIVGIFFGPIGLIAGPFLGATIGELISKRDVLQATKVGVASLIAAILGNIIKIFSLMLSLAIFLSAVML